MSDPTVPDFSRLARKPSERLAIVRHVRETASLEEADYLEWKSAYDLSTKPGAASTARQLIGMANRDVAQAERHAEGSAYVLVGVEPGALHGVPHWDSADIENWLSRYVEPELRYDVHYVELDGKEVLFFTVDAPRQGDPIFCLQRQCDEEVAPGGSAGQGEGKIKKTLPKGAIYVRHGGKTEQHTPDDLKRLGARLAASEPTTHGLAIDIQPSAETSLRRLDLREQSREGFISGCSNQLLGTRWSPRSVVMPGIAGIKAMMGDLRTEEEFAREVARYCQELDRELRGVLLARSVLHDAGCLSLSIVNNTNGTFTGVKVELWITGAVGVCVWEHELDDEAQLPTAPVPYGQKTMANYPGISLSAAQYLPRVGPMEPVWTPAYQETSEGLHVVFADEDVRAEGHRSLPDIWLMLDHEAPDALAIRWEATAKEAKGRLSGEMAIPVAEGLMSIDELLADVPEDDG